MNSVILMGRLAAEPELKYTPSGVPVCTVRLAVDSGYADQSGQRKSDFFNVVCWRGTAEFVSKFFAKGDMMAMSGKIHVRTWEDRFEQKRYDVEITADNVYFGGGRRNTSGGENRESAATNTAPAPATAAYAAFGQESGAGEQARWDYRNDFRPLEEDDEDVPF